jgi:endonuclease-8
MPEGDSLHRTAERLRALEGQVVAVESPHPRAAALGIAPRLDGKRLERVEAVGKNLLFTFEGDVVLRSHLRLRGRWHVGTADARRSGRPWLVLRGETHEAVLWNGPVLELGRGATGRGAVARLGPDIMAEAPDYDAIVARMRRGDQGRELGDALLDQRLVAGIGNVWRSESLFAAGVSPWATLDDVDDAALRAVLESASQAMRVGRGERMVYRRAGLPCRRCGTAIAARRQGEAARTAYWCPSCQAGTATGSA